MHSHGDLMTNFIEEGWTAPLYTLCWLPVLLHQWRFAIDLVDLPMSQLAFSTAILIKYHY